MLRCPLGSSSVWRQTSSRQVVACRSAIPSNDREVLWEDSISSTKALPREEVFLKFICIIVFAINKQTVHTLQIQAKVFCQVTALMHTFMYELDDLATNNCHQNPKIERIIVYCVCVVSFVIIGKGSYLKINLFNYVLVKVGGTN